MLMTRLTFTKFAYILLVCWCVISIVCQMTHEQLASYMYISMGNTSMVRTCKYQVKTELYHIEKALPY